VRWRVESSTGVQAGTCDTCDTSQESPGGLGFLVSQRPCDTLRHLRHFATLAGRRGLWRIRLHHDGPRLLLTDAAFHGIAPPQGTPIMDSRGAVDAVDGAP